MMRKTLLALAIAASPLVICAGTANAQPQAQLLLAQEWFKTGLDFERAGKWSEALTEFKKVADVKKTAPVLFHIGLCESKLGQLADASVDLMRAIEAAKGENKPDVQSAAEAELKEVRPRVPTLMIMPPSGDAKPTKVSIDGHPLSLGVLGTAMPVNPGEHEVAVDFANGTFKKKVSVAEKQQEKVQVEAPTGPAPATTNTPATTGPESATPSSSSTTPNNGAITVTPDKVAKSNVLPWVLVGVGGAAIAGSVVFFIMRQGNIDALDEGCPTRSNCPSSLQSEYDSGKTNSVVSGVLAGVGLAAIGVGATMLVVGGGKSAKTQIVPVAVPGGGGAFVSGRF
jgi:hypothetical protein